MKRISLALRSDFTYIVPSLSVRKLRNMPHSHHLLRMRNVTYGPWAALLGKLSMRGRTFTDPWHSRSDIHPKFLAEALTHHNMNGLSSPLGQSLPQIVTLV